MIPASAHSISPTVSFSWAPQSAPVSFTVGGHTYPYSHQADAVTRTSDDRYGAYTTPTNEELTFTAAVTTYDDTFILRYRWDFGDGTLAYGPEVVKTYLVPNPSIVVALTVHDSNGRDVRVARPLNLVRADPVRVRRVIQV